MKNSKKKMDFGIALILFVNLMFQIKCQIYKIYKYDIIILCTVLKKKDFMC